MLSTSIRLMRLKFPTFNLLPFLGKGVRSACRHAAGAVPARHTAVTTLCSIVATPAPPSFNPLGCRPFCPGAVFCNACTAAVNSSRLGSSPELAGPPSRVAPRSLASFAAVAGLIVVATVWLRLWGPEGEGEVAGWGGGGLGGCSGLIPRVAAVAATVAALARLPAGLACSCLLNSAAIADVAPCPKAVLLMAVGLVSCHNVV